ncbi:MAG: beta-N-acetylhexosaminidase [Polyangiales bacterium]
MALLVTSCSAGDEDTGLIDDDAIGALHLIPAPRKISGDTGHLHFEPSSRIVVSEHTRSVGELLAASLRSSTGWTWDVISDDPVAGDIVLQLDPGMVSEEGYALEVDEREARVCAGTPAGVFYGTQTLLQLLPAEIERLAPVDGVVWRVPMVAIEDSPRFAWRGTMLDVARHFFDAESVKRLIDIAARYKINRFHLHLTDDAGWRIEIKSWPDLTAIGATTDHSGGPGGYYTQEQFADIVAYAAARFVTIVPEIDLPGHTNAALASYAELNESGDRTELTPRVPFGSSSLWIDGPDTARFVDDVVREVAALVPGPYFHIGGDEALVVDTDDYVAFMVMARSIVETRGKIMIGWDEIGVANLDPPFLVQYWLNLSNALAGRGQGAQVIASPAARAYLDMKYDESTPIGQFWAGYTDVLDAYDWDPVPEGLVEADVVGLEAPLWTETVSDAAGVDFLMFPRLLGYAEIGWSPRDGRDWDDYRERLAEHGPRLDARNVGFFRSPSIDWPASSEGVGAR